MKLTSIFRFFISFCLILLVPLFIQVASAKPESGKQIKRQKAQTGPFMTSPDERGKEEGDMTDTDRLTEEEGRLLLHVARQTIEQELFVRKEPKKSDSDLPPKFSEHRGTFVTLTMGGNLRGCIGHIIPQESLIEGIKVNAINAAFRDPRFPSLTKEEWKKVEIEVSILTDPKPLSYSDANDLLKKLRPGIDGVIIKKGSHQATFLPQVWEQLPSKEKFLNHLCFKAGLDRDAWRKGDLEVSTYQVQAFEE
jgi:AmmeMemoRadiSam system protein A